MSVRVPSYRGYISVGVISHCDIYTRIRGNVAMERSIRLKYGLSKKILSEIKDIAFACKVEKVVIFGSRARGDYQKASDIDIAVWGGNTSLFGLEIDEKTSTLLKYDAVNMDLSSLN